MVKENSRQATLPETGFLRIGRVLQIFPVSRATWYSGIASGKYPKPVKLSERISGWRIEDVRALIEQRSANESLT